MTDHELKPCHKCNHKCSDFAIKCPECEVWYPTGKKYLCRSCGESVYMKEERFENLCLNYCYGYIAPGMQTCTCDHCGDPEPLLSQICDFQKEEWERRDAIRKEEYKNRSLWMKIRDSIGL